MFIAIIFVGFLLFTFLKILFGNGASAWKQLKWKGKLYTVIGIVWAIGFMCFGVWAEMENSSDNSNRPSWEEDANDAGYYYKDGKWYYQGH